MSRDLRAFAWFCFGVMLSFAMMVPVYASEYPVNVPGVSAGSDGKLYFTGPNGRTGPVYSGINSTPITVANPPNAPFSRVEFPFKASTAPLTVPIPAPPGGSASSQVMQIPTTISPNAARVAALVVGFARFSGPIGIGLNLANLVCSNTQLCQLPGLNGQPAPNEFGKFNVPAVPVNTIYGLYGSTVYDASTFNAAQAKYCYVYNPTYFVKPNGCNATPNASICYFECVNSGGATSGTIESVKKTSSCPTGYTGPDQYGVCTGPQTVTTPTDNDWQDSIAKLTALTTKMADMVTGLQDKSQPVPIDKPVLSPSSATAPSQSVVNRDATGNVTNTTTTTTTTTNTPVTNNTTTNTTNITQTTITTVTNNAGDTTSTTTTTAEPKPPEEPPEDPTIEFDEVPETPLPEQQLPLSLTTNSWGEGNCPPDPSLSVMGTQMTVPVHVVCGYMSSVRPAVIAFFGLIAAYIVVGVKFEG